MRTWGCHSQRFPAPVSGDTPTCANDVGSRGAMIGFSCPTVIVVFPQLRSSLATRRRIRLLLGTGEPAKKSMYIEPLAFPPPGRFGPLNVSPSVVWRKDAPVDANPGEAPATTGSSAVPLKRPFMNALKSSVLRKRNREPLGTPPLFVWASYGRAVLLRTSSRFPRPPVSRWPLHIRRVGSVDRGFLESASGSAVPVDRRRVRMALRSALDCALPASLELRMQKARMPLIFSA